MSYRRQLIDRIEVRLSPDRAQEFRDRLAALADEMLDAEQDPDGVPMRVLAAWYCAPK